MKHTLILLFTIGFFGMNSQTLKWDSIPKPQYYTPAPLIVSCYKVHVYDDEFGLEAGITCDSVVKVSGDKMMIIRALLERIEKLNQQYIDRTSELEMLVSAGVEFSNEVPDYFKDPAYNCKWPRYNKLLKKEGYKSRKVTTTHKCKK